MLRYLIPFIAFMLLLSGGLATAWAANGLAAPAVAPQSLGLQVHHRCVPSSCTCRGNRRLMCTRDCRRDRHCYCRRGRYVCHFFRMKSRR